MWQLKHNGSGHTAKIGFLISQYNVGYLAKWYTEMITKRLSLKDSDIQISNQRVYEKRYEAQVLEIEAIYYKKEKIDALLKQ